MPTYGYECLSCENQFETYQSIKDDALTTCDACGGTLRKRIYPVGISFKGSGFYVNDYAPAGSARSKPAEGGDTAPASAGSDTKPEAKAEGASSDGTKAEPKADAVSPKAESTPAAKPDAKAPAATP